MKRALIATTFFIGLILVSCNKDQSAVKKLDGTWLLVEQDGSAIPDSSQISYTFTSCKLKSEDYCPATLTYPNNSSENFEYKVSNKGETMTWKSDDGNGNVIEIPGTIDELTETNMTLTFTFIGSTTSKFEKQ